MTAGMDGPAVYQEVQRFSARLLGLVWAAAALLSVVLAPFAPADERASLWVAPLVLLIVLAAIRALFVLRTEVRDSRLSVRLWPLPALALPVSEIAAVEAVEYRPLRDFGGWGWRFGRKGRIYSAAGNRAVRIEAGRRMPIFIGSDTPEALVAALRDARNGPNSAP